LSAILERLATTSSDPKWITDEINAALDALDAPAPAPTEAPPTYQEIVVAGCLSTLMEKLSMQSDVDLTMTPEQTMARIRKQVLSFGQIAAFAGRVAETNRQKYLNTTDTEETVT
jgi:cell division inhibitor SulA